MAAFFSPDNFTTQIPTQTYLELLEYKLDALKAKDISWNYGIEELKLEIEMVQLLLK